jgi:hypothetical protein
VFIDISLLDFSVICCIIETQHSGSRLGLLPHVRKEGEAACKTCFSCTAGSWQKSNIRGFSELGSEVVACCRCMHAALQRKQKLVVRTWCPRLLSVCRKYKPTVILQYSDTV